MVHGKREQKWPIVDDDFHGDCYQGQWATTIVPSWRAFYTMRVLHHDFYTALLPCTYNNENFIERALYSLFSPYLLLLFTSFLSVYLVGLSIVDNCYLCHCYFILITEIFWIFTAGLTKPVGPGLVVSGKYHSLLYGWLDEFLLYMTHWSILSRFGFKNK